MTSDKKSDQRSCRVLWQRRGAYAVVGSLVPLADGALVLSSRGSCLRVESLSVHGGEARWREQIDGPGMGTMARTGTMVVVATKRGLTLLDAKSGRLSATNWSPTGRAYGGVIRARSGGCYTLSQKGRRLFVEAVDLRDQKLRWEWELKKAAFADVDLMLAGDTLIVAVATKDAELRVVALARDNGNMLWERKGPKSTVLHSWAFCDLIDIVLAEGGIWGLDRGDGSDRILRFTSLDYLDARLAGQTFVALLEQDGERILLAMDVVSGELLGTLPTNVRRIVGVHTGEVITEHPDGYPEIFAMPTLTAIAMPEVARVGKTASVAWARDVAYLVAKDRHRVTALDLRKA